LEPLVALTRSNRIESIHAGYICITDSNNNVLYNIGDCKDKVFLRSAAKPFIATTFIKSGAMEQFDISEKELAIICSSHTGEDYHRETISSILNKIGVSEEDLKCGISAPYNKEMNERLIRKNERPSKLYNCCSGKHSGMLAACKALGLPIDSYNDKCHPLQKLILYNISKLLGCSEEDIILGIDGCTVPSFMITIQQISYLYALLADGGNTKEEYKDALTKIRNSMVAYPEMIDGYEEFYTELMGHSDKRMIAKVGDEGLYCVAVPEKKIGIVVKIVDGNERACYPVIIEVLKQLGIFTKTESKQLYNWAFTPLKNHVSDVIGYTLPIFNINKNQSNKNITIGQLLEFKGDNLWNN